MRLILDIDTESEKDFLDLKLIFQSLSKKFCLDEKPKKEKTQQEIDQQNALIEQAKLIKIEPKLIENLPKLPTSPSLQQNNLFEQLLAGRK